jgi:peptidoglycan/LPS O-acetylase OafA/YrhL
MAGTPTRYRPPQCGLPWPRPRLQPWSGAVAAAGIVVAAVLPIDVEDRRVLVVQTIVTVLTCAVVLAPPTLLALSPLRWVGDRSYGLYLWHRPLLLSPPATWLPNGWQQAVGVALAVGAAAASYRWLEIPVRRAVRRRRSAVGCGQVVPPPAAAALWTTADVRP